MASIAIGVLRFTNLTAKSRELDEFCRTVFSLGNSFDTVPRSRNFSLDTAANTYGFALITSVAACLPQFND